MKTFAAIVALLSIVFSSSGAGTNAIKNGQLQNQLNAAGNGIVNLKDPSSAQDAATKVYVDTHGGGGGSATNAYVLQVSGSGLVLTTNGATFVYTLALNAALQGWSIWTTNAFAGLFDTNGAALAYSKAATNGYPWGSLYDTAGAATAATNNIGPASGLAAFQFWPYYSVVASDTTASIQATLNKMTNGGVLLLAVTNYPITANLIVTNKNVIIDGNGATFTFQNGLTNAMLMATNPQTPFTVRNLTFDGGTRAIYNSTNYFTLQNGILVGHIFDPAWTNRTGLRVDASGGALVQHCNFYGWSGQGCMVVETGGTFNAQKMPKARILQNVFAGNFIGLNIPGASYEYPGYYNADASLWNSSNNAEYALVEDNITFTNQCGMSITAGNCKVRGNTCDIDFIGIASYSGANGQHGDVSGNTLNHAHGFAIWAEGGANASHYEGNIIRASSAVMFSGITGVEFIDNTLGQASLIFTNGCSGRVQFNQFQFGAVWGSNSLTFGIMTNFTGSPALTIQGNVSEDGTNSDGSLLSQFLISNSIPAANIYGTIATARLGIVDPASGRTNVVLQKSDGTFSTNDLANFALAGSGGSGTVTSVGLSAPAEFTVSGSPVTGSGTLSFVRGADANYLGFGATNIGFLRVTNTAQIGGEAFINGLVVTNGLTNSSLTPNSIVQTDGNRRQVTMANGVGALTNDASGNFGWAPLLRTAFLGNAPGPAYFDSGTNLMPMLVYTNCGAGTNLSFAFDGFPHRADITNGPDVFLNFSGSNGSWSFKITTNVSVHSTTAFNKFLAGSNGVSTGVYKITNGIFSVSSYGGTNATQLVPAIGEFQ